MMDNGRFSLEMRASDELVWSQRDCVRELA